MTTEAHIELPPNVGVETLTLISFEDGSPMQFVFAGSDNDLVKHGTLNTYGAALYLSFMQLCFIDGDEGVESVRTDHAEDLCGPSSS